MSRFRVELSEPAKGYVRGQPKKAQGQIGKRLRGLEDNPRPHGSEKLKGTKNPPLYRVRTGDHRIIYTIDYRRNKVDVLKIADRRDAYD